MENYSVWSAQVSIGIDLKCVWKKTRNIEWGKIMPLISVPIKKCSQYYSYLFAVYSRLGTVRDKNILTLECTSAVQVSGKYSFLADSVAPLIEP